MQKAVMQLETLTCPSCIKKVESALGNVKGVAEVKVLFNASKAKVEFDGAHVSADELQKAIEKLGYAVLSIKTN